MYRCLAFTLRIERHNHEALMRYKSDGKPYILSVWHACVLWTPFFHRRHGIRALVSASRDGEIIARVVEATGNATVRGSSRRGGSKAFRQLLRLANEGNPICIVPDGPLGPAFESQGGVSTLSAKTDVVVIPFHYESARQWVAHGAWDKHRIPKPFSHIHLKYGEPFTIPRGLTSLEARNLVQDRMIKNMHECQKLAGLEPGHTT
jgi:lysophospholipid acyltransferase (LPLAT)-like uncharacterized protein